jgi:hypothetical protein
MLTEARLYATDSIGHTMDYQGWEDQYAKRDRITYGKFGQLWVCEFCKLNGIPYEKDKSSPKVNDDFDLKIGEFSIDVKTTIRNDIQGQVSPGVYNKPIDYYLFLVTDSVCSFVRTLGFVSQSAYKKNALKINKGEKIPGTNMVQRFSYSYFLPYEIPVWIPFLKFFDGVSNNEESFNYTGISPIFSNDNGLSELNEKVDLLIGEKNKTNSLLLQLLDQTKSVKPAKRGNVVSINDSLFGESA